MIGPMIGNVVNLSASALRENPVELRGNGTWNKMSAVATFSRDVRTAELLRIEYRPLPADAKRIIGKLIAAGGGAALERASLAHNSNPATDLNAEAQGGGEQPLADALDAGQAAAAAASRLRRARAPHGSRLRPARTPRKRQQRRPLGHLPPRNGSGQPKRAPASPPKPARHLRPPTPTGGAAARPPRRRLRPPKPRTSSRRRRKQSRRRPHC